MTTLVRWEPFRELGSLSNEMSRWMNNWMNGTFEGPSGQPVRSWVPALDVWETENDVVYAFDLPGIPEDKISIEVADGTLTVSAEREHREEVSDDRFFRYERRFGTFTRAVGLPQGVKEDQINASYRDGVLEIRVPKPEEKKPRRIALTSTVEGNARQN